MKRRTGQSVQLSRERSLPGSTVSTGQIVIPRKPNIIQICERTRHVLVTPERSNNSGVVSKDDFIVGGRREEALKEGDGRVENNSAFYASLNSDFDLTVVHEVAVDSLDVRGRLAVEISIFDQGS